MVSEMRIAYLVSPHASTRNNVATCGIPFYICYSVMLLCIHEHEIGSDLVVFGLVTLIIHIVEVEVTVLLDRDSTNQDESTLW